MSIDYRSIVVAVLGGCLVGACQPAKPDPEHAARRIIAQADKRSGVSLINLVMSPDRTVLCGMARIGPVRTTPYWIKLERPFPDLDGQIRVRLAPSIDAAKDKPAARTAAMRALIEIPRRCAEAGAPLPSYL